MLHLFMAHIKAHHLTSFLFKERIKIVLESSRKSRQTEKVIQSKLGSFRKFRLAKEGIQLVLWCARVLGLTEEGIQLIVDRLRIRSLREEHIKFVNDHRGIVSSGKEDIQIELNYLGILCVLEEHVQFILGFTCHLIKSHINGEINRQLALVLLEADSEAGLCFLDSEETLDGVLQDDLELTSQSDLVHQRKIWLLSFVVELSCCWGFRGSWAAIYRPLLFLEHFRASGWTMEDYSNNLVIGPFGYLTV